jgi:hypothetical protein
MSKHETDSFLSRKYGPPLVGVGIDLLENGLDPSFLEEALMQTIPMTDVPVYQRPMVALISSGRAQENMRLVEDIRSMINPVPLMEIEEI